MKTINLHVDYRKDIQDLAFKSIRRGLTFTAMSISSEPTLDGVNKTINPKLDTGLEMELVKSLEQNDFIKTIDWYRHYINACGLREILEGFQFFIDKTIWFVGIKKFMEQKKPIAEFHDFNQEHKSYESQTNYNKKLNELNASFAQKMTNEQINCLMSLNRVRNCLAHNMGVVNDFFPKAKKEGYAKIEWMRFNVYTIGCETGQKRRLKLGSKANEPRDIVAKHLPYTKELPYGSYLFFEYKEIHEIAFSLHNAICIIGEQVKKIYEVEANQ